MIAEGKDITSETTVGSALKLLDHSARRGVSVDERRSSFARLFKNMPREERKIVCEQAVDLLKGRLQSRTSADDSLIVLLSGLAYEKDWESCETFLHALLSKISDNESMRNLAIALLDLADNELGTRSKYSVGETALVLLSELGLMIANRVGLSSLDKGMSKVVDYITTSLIARSNVSNIAMRIALVYYLSHGHVTVQTTQQFNRVIGRFGQSLLSDIFSGVFEDKKRSAAAFYFLVEHLHMFLTVSPTLARMAHDVMRHYMLKFPHEFPSFLTAFLDNMKRDNMRMVAMLHILALLLRDAIDVSKRDLAENIMVILLQHIAQFSDVSSDAVLEQIQEVRAILAHGRRTSAEIVLEDLYKELARMEAALMPNAQVQDARNKNNVVSLAKTRRPSVAKRLPPLPKPMHTSRTPTLLDTMLALAS